MILKPIKGIFTSFNDIICHETVLEFHEQSMYYYYSKSSPYILNIFNFSFWLENFFFNLLYIHLSAIFICNIKN